MPELKDVVIIAASASAFEEDKQRSLAAGCNDFISG
jgi:CheY-like chemotaxis protein